ncbi:NAD(P)-dependent oxidoreductase [Halovivax limisalsi]|uniref:NAD(P)-dependent oxidoreductase n=1 Tax=Halovivax limisalsi TaxID=1453760 RepID=UPI001FFDC381|nr:NAD(P)-dependent oxidoreductase [Halovivax limisalsi]
MPPTIGVVGLGNMGKPMAENLVDAGYDVVVHNRSPEPVEAVEAYGATAAASPRAVADRSDVVVTCLPDSDALEAVALGESGLVDGFDSGTVLVDTSTISPVASRRVASALEEVGAAMLDAPVSGGTEGAAAGTLSIMVGGDEAVFETCRPILETLGETITYCGGPGSGQVTKVCNQIIVSVTMQGICEALVFAATADADLEAVLGAVRDGTASCWMLDNRAADMIAGEFDPGFFAEYQYKDLCLATDAGDAYEAPMPATKTAQEHFKAAVAMGYGREANTAVVKVLEELAGVTLRDS